MVGIIGKTKLASYKGLLRYIGLGYSRKNPHSHDGRHAGKSHGSGG